MAISLRVLSLGPRVRIEDNRLVASTGWSFIVPMKLGDTVHRFEDQLRLWRRVVDLDRGLELPVPLVLLRPWTPSRRALDEFFGRFGFPRWESAVDRFEE